MSDVKLRREFQPRTDHLQRKRKKKKKNPAGVGSGRQHEFARATTLNVLGDHPGQFADMKTDRIAQGGGEANLKFRIPELYLAYEILDGSEPAQRAPAIAELLDIPEEHAALLAGLFEHIAAGSIPDDMI